MNTKIFIRIITVIYLVIYTAIGTAFAVEDTPEFNPIAINKVLDKAERELKRQTIRINKLDEYFKNIKTYRVLALSCVDSKNKLISAFAEKSKLLEEKVKGESLNVTKKRNDLFKQETKLKNELTSCKVIVLRTEELSYNINRVKQQILAQRLLAQGPDFFSLILKNWDNPSLWTDALKKIVFEHSGLLELK
ncbi:MAG: hypothetical protein ACC653_08340, partial [Gammaproteobacteria bacterium]